MCQKSEFKKRIVDLVEYLYDMEKDRLAIPRETAVFSVTGKEIKIEQLNLKNLGDFSNILKVAK